MSVVWAEAFECSISELVNKGWAALSASDSCATDYACRILDHGGDRSLKIYLNSGSDRTSPVFSAHGHSLVFGLYLPTTAGTIGPVIKLYREGELLGTVYLTSTYVRYDGGSVDTTEYTTKLNHNKWHFIAVTGDFINSGGYVRINVDGSTIIYETGDVSDASTETNDGFDQFKINRTSNSGYYFNLDDFVVRDNTTITPWVGVRQDFEAKVSCTMTEEGGYFPAIVDEVTWDESDYVYGIATKLARTSFGTLDDGPGLPLVLEMVQAAAFGVADGVPQGIRITFDDGSSTDYTDTTDWTSATIKPAYHYAELAPDGGAWTTTDWTNLEVEFKVI